MKFQKVFVGAIALAGLMASSAFAEPPKTLSGENCKSELAAILATKAGETVNLDHAVSGDILTLHFTRVGKDNSVQRSILQTSYSAVESELKEAAKRTPYTVIQNIGMGPMQIHGKRDDLDAALLVLKGKKIGKKSVNPVMSSEMPLVLSEIAGAACTTQVKYLALMNAAKSFANGAKDAYQKFLGYFNPSAKPVVGQFKTKKFEKPLTLTASQRKILFEFPQENKSLYTDRDLELQRMKAHRAY